MDIVEKITEVQLSPNPTANDVDIQLSDDFIGKSINIELYDITGKKYIVRQNLKIDADNKTAILNLNDIPKGIYFLNVVSDNKTIYKNKLVKL